MAELSVEEKSLTILTVLSSVIAAVSTQAQQQMPFSQVEQCQTCVKHLS